MLRRLPTASLRPLAGRAIRLLGDALLPRTCVFCGLPPDRGVAFRWQSACADCAAELPVNAPCCGRCAAPLAADAAAGLICGACQTRPPPFSLTIAPLRYEFPVDAAIKAFKFRKKLYYAPMFGHLLAESLAAAGTDFDAMLAVPLHWRRRLQRGFNQAEEIARQLARHVRAPPLIRPVTRRRATVAQSGLDAGERRRNLAGAFHVRGRIAARRVLIVDDVVTTGETCRQLSKLLKHHGVEDVAVIAVARA